MMTKHAQRCRGERLHRLLKASGVDSYITADKLGGGVHVFVPLHVCAVVNMFLRREGWADYRVSSLNLALDEP